MSGKRTSEDIKDYMVNLFLGLFIGIPIGGMIIACIAGAVAYMLD